jgi:molybdopterin molybdotransferase
MQSCFVSELPGVVQSPSSFRVHAPVDNIVSQVETRILTRDSSMLTIQQAHDAINAHVDPFEAHDVSLPSALGFTLAADVTTPHDSPPFAKSMMDGFGLTCASYMSGRRSFRVTQLIAAGTIGMSISEADEAVRIMTGASIPAGVDMVIPIEQSNHDPSTNIVTFPDLSVRPNLNVILQGSNKQAGQPLLRAGTKLRAQHIGALAEFGIAHVPVRRRPTVAIRATGNELVPYNFPLVPGVEFPFGAGLIRNSNEPMLAAQIMQAGGEPIPLGIAPDDPDTLADYLVTGLESDIFLLTGGVSAGDFDFVPPTLKSLGVTEVFHKIQLKPGKPLWFGVYNGPNNGNTCYVFGLPGNPVSSLVCFELFVRPTIEKLMGLPGFPLSMMTATLKSDASHHGDRPTYHPASLEWTATGPEVQTVPWKGSSDLSATIAANCTIAFPAGTAQYPAGSQVQVHAWLS